MDAVNEFCNLLQSYANRDKIVSLTCYTLKLWGSTGNHQSLLTASARLAGARTTLRLFDDASAIKALLNYGLGVHEGPLWGALGVASGTLTVAYLQAEKGVWLIDAGILKLSNETDFAVKTTHRLFWSLSAFVGLLRSIRALNISAAELNSPNKRKCSRARFTQSSLAVTKMFLDVVHAVSWLPEGWLWGSKLSTQKASAVATASAVLALVIHYQEKRLAPMR